MMTHLKTFNEGFTDKDESNVDDMLLEFVDSAELSNIIISHYVNEMSISFEFSEGVFGMKKVILIDKIVNRLKRKYPNIYTEGYCLCINLQKIRNRKYIDFSILEKVNSILDSIFKKSIRKEADGFPDVIFFYPPNEKKLFMEYYKSDKSVLIDSEMWELFEDIALDDYDIRDILSQSCLNMTGLEVSDITFSQF